MPSSPHSRRDGSGLRFAVVGNPENRRTAMFADAVRTAGYPAPRVVAWRDVLRGRYAFTAGESVRIDSPGENAEVGRMLRGADDPTRVEGTAVWYRRPRREGPVCGAAAIRTDASRVGHPVRLPKREVR